MTNDKLNLLFALASLPFVMQPACVHCAPAAPPANMIYVDIGDSAHFVMLDQPAAFQAALMAFVGK